LASLTRHVFDARTSDSGDGFLVLDWHQHPLRTGVYDPYHRGERQNEQISTEYGARNTVQNTGLSRTKDQLYSREVEKRKVHFFGPSQWILGDRHVSG